jgi:hypothetical protein
MAEPVVLGILQELRDEVAELKRRVDEISVAGPAQ